MSESGSSRAALVECLRGCIGRRVTWRGETLQLQDILAAEARLVFSAPNSAATLQADQHGDPRRRAPVLRELPALNDRGTGPSEIAEALLQAASGPR